MTSSPNLWARCFTTLQRIVFKLDPQEPTDNASEYHIAFIGRKAEFLPLALRRFVEDYAQSNKVKAQASGLTPELVPSLPTLHLQPALGRPSRVICHDFTGSRAEEISLPSVLDGVIYLVDAPAVAPVEEMPGTMFRGRRFDLPLALVVIVPSDSPASLPIHELSGPYAGRAVAAQEAERDSAAVRLFLVHAGIGDFANALELRFKQVAFFAVRLSDPPQGVLAPLFWLCHHTGAITDAPPLQQALNNVQRYVRLALQGRHGRQAANVVWGLIVIGGPLALLFVALLFGWKIGAISILALLSMTIWQMMGRKG